jgi:hypothetical protein
MPFTPCRPSLHHGAAWNLHSQPDSGCDSDDADDTARTRPDARGPTPASAGAAGRWQPRPSDDDLDRVDYGAALAMINGAATHAQQRGAAHAHGAPGAGERQQHGEEELSDEQRGAALADAMAAAASRLPPGLGVGGQQQAQAQHTSAAPEQQRQQQHAGGADELLSARVSALEAALERQQHATAEALEEACGAVRSLEADNGRLRQVRDGRVCACVCVGRGGGAGLGPIYCSTLAGIPHIQTSELTNTQELGDLSTHAGAMITHMHEQLGELLAMQQSVATRVSGVQVGGGLSQLCPGG